MKGLLNYLRREMSHRKEEKYRASLYKEIYDPQLDILVQVAHNLWVNSKKWYDKLMFSQGSKIRILIVCQDANDMELLQKAIRRYIYARYGSHGELCMYSKFYFIQDFDYAKLLGSNILLAYISSKLITYGDIRQSGEFFLKLQGRMQSRLGTVYTTGELPILIGWE